MQVFNGNLSVFSQQLNDAPGNPQKSKGGLGTNNNLLQFYHWRACRPRSVCSPDVQILIYHSFLVHQHFPSLPCLFMVRCKFERGVFFKVNLVFLLENAVVHICSQWCPASVRPHSSARGEKSRFSPLRIICQSVLSPPLATKSRDKAAALTGLPPSRCCCHLLLNSSSNSLLSNISSKRVYLLSYLL